MSQFQVSVIIPVYNAELYIEKAIQSALRQPEVAEVIVVNDGSTDNSLNLIEALQKIDDKVKVFHHPNNQNKGRAASRNLGIEKATSNYIAFLDADDFYLENRFKNDFEVFNKSEKIDGVYNAIGAKFYREAGLLEKQQLELTTVSSEIHPKDLFETLLYYKKGHFSIDGLTIKKTVFNQVGYFNEKLEVSEDTHLILKMTLKAHLVSGLIDTPVAMRGVHDANVFNQEHLYEKQKLRVYKSLLVWASQNEIPLTQIDHILNILWVFKYRQNKGLIKNTTYWLCLFFKTPKLLFTTLSVKYFPVVRLRRKLFPFLYKG